MGTLLFMLGMLAGAAGTLTLTVADGAPPLRAETLAANAALGALLQELDSHPQAVLRIRHAGGEAGSGFAQQLRDALVALGLPSSRSRLVPAAADADRLILEISANGETQP